MRDPVGELRRRSETPSRRAARRARRSPSRQLARARLREHGAEQRMSRKTSFKQVVDGGIAGHLVCSGHVPGTVPGTWRLQPGCLEQLQPELAPGRERRDGVGEPLERDLADDGDRRRVQASRRPRSRRTWRRRSRPGVVDARAATCPACSARRSSRRRSRWSPRRPRARPSPPPPPSRACDRRPPPAGR